MKQQHLQSGRKEQKQKTRSKILSATHKLLELGKELTMEEIAEKAGISRATIYRYYNSTDAISTELLLQLNVPDSKSLSRLFENSNPVEVLMGLQKAYLRFSLDNENASRKFLTAVLDSSNPKLERGKNRITSINTYFASQEINLSSEDKKKLIHISVLLMGIESIIAMKDVCELKNSELMETLKWGLEMILKGCQLNE